MRKLCLAIFFTTAVFACKKDNAFIYNKGILGKWQLTEYYVGIGGPTEWQAPSNDFKHTVEFKSNGDFISNSAIYYDADAFELSNSITFNF